MNVIQFEEQPELESPTFIGAFRGWNDGGQAATTAAGHLKMIWSGDRFAYVDPEELFDFQVTRPHVLLDEGQTRQIEWPSVELFHARAEGRDFVFVIGDEPSLRWRTFSGEVVELAKSYRAQMFLTLGGFLADVPHTRTAPVTGATTESSLASKLDMVPSHYQGPTGIVGVLHGVASDAGIPSLTLWTAVSHYVGGEPNPRAARNLLEKVGELLEVSLDLKGLRQAEQQWESRINAVVEADDDLSTYVRRLEDAFSEQELPGRMASGDELAAEFERFLRDQRGNGT